MLVLFYSYIHVSQYQALSVHKNSDRAWYMQIKIQLNLCTTADNDKN